MCNVNKLFEKSIIGMDGLPVATIPAKKSKLREVLNKEYVKTVILIVILVGGVAGFWLGIRVVLRMDEPLMSVVSESMEPTLMVGDLIVVQGYADPSTIYAAPPIWDETHTHVLSGGDILVFWHRDIGRLVHRAVGNFTLYGKRYLITQGDNWRTNSSPDTHYNLTSPGRPLPGLPEEYVIGKVVANVPYLGDVLLFLQTPLIRMIIIVVIVALLIVEFVPFSKKKDEEQVPKQEQVKA